MKFTWSWLKDFVIPRETPEGLARRLTESGTETQVFDLYSDLKDLEIVQIEKIEAHPNAQRLNLCTVSTQQGPITVVCGASNVRLGMLVVLIRSGQRLPGNAYSLSPTIIRGIESSGMLCSEKELNLEGVFENQEEGILEISSSEALGKTLACVLPKDWLFDCEVTPNRGDLMSVFGIARELVALNAAHWKDVIWPHPLSQATFTTLPVHEIRVETDLCYQFHMAQVQRHSKNPYCAPAWVKRRLKNIQKSLCHDVVDALSYYTHCFGTPFHVFDGSTLKSPLVVDQLKDPACFTALSCKEDPAKVIQIPCGSIVLKDEGGILALSGILGGDSSKYQPSSTLLCVEAAEFDPKTISLTGQKALLMTHSRKIFERGIDGAEVKNHLIQALT
ncbi:phenylalanine--tRNA ligase beta subunit [Holospora obtusa F1]|uniref:Phenylalanine--tRNA ligase beta subunit n=1 Tax=Holospora obtusa F1 TaxID=1399147 RepID=W6TTG3_HOLOB|nr:phenylalanine--tRNA ligase beta subunit-related protein [Holospora obtusa]ETZ07082.1 phenylalanine--tRNA ligase beta subunit [Holospora obtusa F1]